MLLLRPALRQRPLLRLRPARSWGRLQRQYRQGPLKEPMRLLAKGPLRLLLLRKRSPKGWLLRNAPHQRGRPTQRKSPARLLKRNEYKRATSWPVCYRPLADISLTSTNVRFRTRFMYFPRIRQIGSSFGVRVPPIAKSRRERKPMTAMGHKQCNRHVCFIPERGHSDRQVLCRGTTSLTTRLMADDPLHQQLRRDTTGPRRRIPGYSLRANSGNQLVRSLRQGGGQVYRLSGRPALRYSRVASARTSRWRRRRLPKIACAASASSVAVPNRS